MANEIKHKKVNRWLIAVLGILIVVAVSVAISNKKEAADPTFTAAPPIVATPGHPIVLHTKSQEEMAMEDSGASVPVHPGASGQPAAKP
jgi:hypothetical protein